MQTLIHEYTLRRDDAEVRLGKGHPDYIAYWNIVDALSKPEPKQAILVKITAAQDAIVENDQRDWNRRDGYRGYYRRKIKLYAQALRDLDGAKEVQHAATI
jgi:hypothetical protein